MAREQKKALKGKGQVVKEQVVKEQVVKEPGHYPSYVRGAVQGRKPKSAPSVLQHAVQAGRQQRLFPAILTEATKKPESHLTSLEKMAIAKEGITKNDFELLKEKTGLDYDQLAKVLSVSRTTLINAKGDARFNQPLSERIIGLTDLYSYGYEVFEDEERFNDWIFRPNRALGGKKPFDLLDNQFGREEVRNIIGRIEYGVYS